MSRPLTWKDAFAAWFVAWVGALVIGIILLPLARRGPFPALATYGAHAWLFAVPMFWYFGLGRRFPVGAIRWRELRPWAWSWLAVAAVILGSAPFIHGGVRQSWLVMAQSLLMATVLVGPTEEFLSRGLVQTGLNNSITWALQVRSVQVRGGTILASVLFGLAHLANLFANPIGAVLPQVAGATFIGLVIGLLYDRYPNLWGASILHDVIDGLQAILVYV